MEDFIFPSIETFAEETLCISARMFLVLGIEYWVLGKKNLNTQYAIPNTIHTPSPIPHHSKSANNIRNALRQFFHPQPLS